MAPRYSQKTIFNMASVRHFEFEKFRFLSIFHARNGNLHLGTEFDQKFTAEIKPFSKWRPSTILNLRKLQFWSRDGYLHVTLHGGWPAVCSSLACDYVFPVQISH